MFFSNPRTSINEQLTKARRDCKHRKECGSVLICLKLGEMIKKES
jgi:hypothetical protein